MRYDPTKSRLENLLDLGIELCKTSFLLWITVPFLCFLWFMVK